MLNKATKLINKQAEERTVMADKAKAVIKDAQDALKVLGFEEASLDEIFQETKETIQPVVINKGHIVEVQTVKEVYVTNDEELNRLYDENARHIRRINELTEESIQLENEITFKDGQIIGLNKQVKELEDKVAELQSALNAKKLTKENTNIKGGGAVSSEPKQPKRNPLIDKIKKAKDWTIEEAVNSAKEDMARKAEEKEAAKAKLPEYLLEYNERTFDKSIESRTMFGIYGTITIDKASYKFEATNNHHMPIVYGCYDEEVIRIAKEIIMNEVERFTFMNERERGAANYAHINDAEFPLVVWRLTDDKGNVTYHGYGSTKQYDYVLTWDKKKYNYVGRKLVKNLFTDQTNAWKKLANESHANKFRAVCKEIWPEDFTNDDNDPEPTKDKKQHQVTKEQHQSTNEQHSNTKDKVFRVTKEQHQSTNEIHQTTEEQHNNTKEQHQNTEEFFEITKEQHQVTNEGPVVYNGPLDNFTRKPQVTNDNVDLDGSDEIDL